jgi:hypothetical protein
LSKLGLVIIVASLAALAGNSLTAFKSNYSSSARTLVTPESLESECDFFRSYTHEIIVSTNGTVELMFFPLRQILYPANDFENKSLLKATIDNWESVVFKPDRRGAYSITFSNIGEATVQISFTIATYRTFEWDFLYDSLIIAAAGGVLSLAGLLVEKAFKRRQTP